MFACAFATTAAIANDTAKPASLRFEYKDWVVVCDNTRTCRAVGYPAQEGMDSLAVLLISRAAGPQTAVTMQVQTSRSRPYAGATLLKSGGLVLATLQGDMKLSQVQATAMLAALPKANRIDVIQGTLKYAFSTVGVNAVLLKMDEFQGRLDTPGALVRRGSKPESSVLPALPAPQLLQALPQADKPQDNKLLKPISAAIERKELVQICGPNAGEEFALQRLTANTVLMSLRCSVSAYNSATLLWIANDSAPYAPRLLEATGDFDAETGLVEEASKVRGLGDCWAREAWQFNGKDFTLASQSADGLCRGVAGDTWQLPSYVTDMVSPKGKVKK